MNIFRKIFQKKISLSVFCDHEEYEEGWLVQGVRMRTCKKCDFTESWENSNTFNKIPKNYFEDSEMQGSTHKHEIYIDGAKKYSYFNIDSFDRKVKELKEEGKNVSTIIKQHKCTT
jgi:hypothetical protein